MNFHFRNFLMLSVCLGAGVTAHASSRIAEDNIYNALVKKNGYTYQQACSEGQAMGLDLNRIERFRQFRQAAVENTTTVTRPAQLTPAVNNVIPRVTAINNVMPNSLMPRNMVPNNSLPRIAAPTSNHQPQFSSSIPARVPASAQFVANQDHDDDLMEAMRQSVIEDQVHQRKLEVERKEVERQGNIRRQEAARQAQEQRTREDNARAVALARQRLERVLQPAEFTGDQLIESVGEAAQKTRLNEIRRAQQLENAMRALQIHGKKERDLQPAELTEEEALALAMKESEAAEQTRQDSMRHAQQLEIEQQDPVAASRAYQARWYNVDTAEQQGIKAKRLLQLQQDEQLAREEQIREDYAHARKLGAQDEYQPNDHQPTPPRGTADIQSYTIKRMPGSYNNCGFYSMCNHLLGDDFKTYNPRQFATDYLLDAADNEKIRNQVAPEIRRAVLLEPTLLLEPTFKQTSKINDSIASYWKLCEEQDGKVRQINDQLGVGGWDYNSIMRSRRVNDLLKGQLAEINRRRCQAFNEIVTWSTKPETYKAYIESQIKPDYKMLSYHYGDDEFGNEANNSGVIDAIAELFNLKLEVYQYDVFGQYELKYEYIATTANATARLLHHAGNGTSINAGHYDILEKRAQ